MREADFISKLEAQYGIEQNQLISKVPARLAVQVLFYNE